MILGSFLSGGLHPTPIAAAQGSTLGLSFYVLLAPIALWVGFTLLAVRALLAVPRRLTSPDRSASLPSWSGAALRWLVAGRHEPASRPSWARSPSPSGPR